MNEVYICYFRRDYEGIIGLGPVFEKEKDAKLWVEQQEYLGNDEATYKIADFNPKIHCCKTCKQTRLSAGTCIDMTCFIGYTDGDHDGWIDDNDSNFINENEVDNNEVENKVI